MSHPRHELAGLRLYALVTERFCRRPWLETARLVLAGGADAIQLREKEMPDRELLARARALRELTSEAGALLIINDRADVAVLSGADGVHLGQEDLPPDGVRRLAGEGFLIGQSTGSPEQARAAEALGADYIGVGPFAATATKDVAEGKGPGQIREVCAAVRLPVVAVGGITRENAGVAVGAGASGVAVCSALCAAEDPEAAARQLRAVVEQARRGRTSDDG